MFGIVAYAGKYEAYPILIKGLEKLEYRGYDSAGIGTVNGAVHLHKREGKVKDLVSYCANKNTTGKIGLGHTRWATHGCASNQNAHPHQSQSKRLTLVHNGIIENYEALKMMLKEHNFKFESDTDSEVLVQLVEWYQMRYNLSARVALGRALQDVQGSYAVVLHDAHIKNQILAARSESPLVIGLGKEGHFVSSDAMTFDQSTKSIIMMCGQKMFNSSLPMPLLVQTHLLLSGKGKLQNLLMQNRKTDAAFLKKPQVLPGYTHAAMKPN